MKKLLLAFFLASAPLAGPAGAEVINIAKFGGINTDESPLALQNGQSPDSENVLTDNGVGLQPREGFVQFSTEPSRGLWSFGKTDGTRYLIAVSSGHLKATTGSNFTIQIATVSTTVATRGVTLGNTFYFMNTVDGLKAWDGTATTTVDPTKKGIAIAAYKGRLVIGGVTGSERTIYLSRYLNGQDFTLPSTEDDTAPAQIVAAGALDEGISGFYGTFLDRLMIFKPNSTQSLSGSRRSNFSLRTISDSVGLTDGESVRDCDGKLRWLSRGRKIYEFDGASFYKISEDVDEMFADIEQGDSASRENTQTTQSDFSSGSINFPNSLSVSYLPGSVLMPFPDNFSTYRKVGGTDPQIWAEFLSANSTAYLSSGGLRLQATNFSTATIQTNEIAISTTAIASGVTVQFLLRDIGTSVFFERQLLHFVISTMTVSEIKSKCYGTPTSCATDDSVWFYRWTSTSSLTAKLNLGRNFKVGDEPVYTAATTVLPATYTFVLNATNYIFKINNSVNKSGAHSFSNVSPFYLSFWLKDNDSTDPSTEYAVIDNVRIDASTSVFTSNVIDAGDAISSWGPTVISETNQEGVISYQINSSSQSVLSLFNPSSWTSLTNGVAPSIGVNRYLAYRAIFYSTNATTSASLDSLSVNWNEGSVLKTVSAYSNQRYWLGVSVSSTVNNKVFVYDKKNQWQRFSGINADAMTIYNSNLYFGNPYGIFQAEIGTTDNGSAISAYYKTKPLAGTSLDLGNTYSKLRMTTERSDDTLGTSFRIDGDDTDYSLGSYQMNQNPGIQNFKLPFSSGEVQSGRYIDFKWSVSGTTFWRILNGNLYFDPDVVVE